MYKVAIVSTVVFLFYQVNICKSIENVGEICYYVIVITNKIK